MQAKLTQWDVTNHQIQGPINTPTDTQSTGALGQIYHAIEFNKEPKPKPKLNIKPRQKIKI